MTKKLLIPRDPDLRGVPDALRRAAEKTRRLAEQTGTQFVVRELPAVRNKAKETVNETRSRAPSTPKRAA